MNEQNPSHSMSRRRLLGTTGGAGLAGLAAGGMAGQVLARRGGLPLTSLGQTAVPFHGRHQAGITTPLQAYGHLAAFDLLPGAGRAAAAGLLRRWSQTAETMTAGQP